MDVDAFTRQVGDCTTLPYIERDELYEKMESVRALLGITLDDYPVDFGRVLQKLSPVLAVHTEPFEYRRFCGFLIKNRLPARSHVVINSRLNPEDQYFAAVHELVHFLCHDVERFLCNPFTQTVHGKFEWQANEGAAELILPQAFFVEDFLLSLDVYRDFGLAIQNTAAVNRVCEQVVRFRLKNLKRDFASASNILADRIDAL